MWPVRIIFMINLSLYSAYSESLIRIPCHRTKGYDSMGDFQVAKTNTIHGYLINQANFYWVGPISVGTPGTIFLVNFDTGSTDLWIPSIDCRSNCEKKQKYDSKISKTSKTNGAKFRIKYADGSSAYGTFVNDTIRIGDTSIENQPIAVAEEISGFSLVIFDGVLGLGYSSLGTAGQLPFIFNLWEQNLILDRVFSFYFNPDPEMIPGGELILGGIDSSKFTGSIVYADVVLQAYWEFLVDRISVTQEIICSPCRTILDTGTTLIIGPKEWISQLNSIIGAEYQSETDLYLVDCMNRSISSFPDVNIVIRNSTLTLSAVHYLMMINYKDVILCYSVFRGVNLMDSSGNLIWIFGSYFLTRYYSIYDFQHHRIGLAKSISYNHHEILTGMVIETSNGSIRRVFLMQLGCLLSFLWTF